ncbi:MAG TPA: TIR domain-containing protein [Pyrinomonadaceae bacterium]|nr:TIR domain-containing protein [Pyrinomonadaceae bacterium]
MPRPKILLVDDDEDFLKIAQEFLELNGYDVKPTTDLAEGRRLLEENAIAVAFIDINFNLGDHHDKRGLELAIDTISTSAIPKVILTVHRDFKYARESLMPRLGKEGAALEFLYKGDGMPQMVATIERIVRRAKVFLSYSSPDRPTVKKFYQQLQMSGLLPWMDCMDIEPGEDWSMAVRSAIRTADFAVVFLSKSGLDRKGPYQEEISLILKIQRERPPGRVFAVPTRINECEIPHEELNALQRVDLFAPDGYKKLVGALKTAINQRDKTQ